MSHSLPYALILFRLVLGPVLLWLTLKDVSSGWLLLCLTLGLLSDGLDGMLARRLRFAIGVALLSHIERIAITLLLPTWTHDVPSLFHAWRKRGG